MVALELVVVVVAAAVVVGTAWQLGQIITCIQQGHRGRLLLLCWGGLDNECDDECPLVAAEDDRRSFKSFPCQQAHVTSLTLCVARLSYLWCANIRRSGRDAIEPASRSLTFLLVFVMIGFGRGRPRGYQVPRKTKQRHGVRPVRHPRNMQEWVNRQAPLQRYL